MDPVHTTLGALAAGVVTSLHCAGMCGPIACGLLAAPAGDAGRWLGPIAYHGARLFSYAVIGAVCGAIGRQPLQWFFGSPAVVLPWMLVAVLLVFALGLEKKLPRPLVLSKFSARMRFRGMRSGPVKGGLLLGLMTPLLPCGPLYMLFAASLLSGSAVKGAEFALAFGLGTVPLLWVAQHQLGRLGARITPAAMAGVRRGLALVAAMVLTWRLHGTIPAFRPEPAELPSCCHH
jgi:sulfite exporter TauE/SafE